MKLFSTLLIGLTLSAFALDINEIAGRYKGTCTDTYKKHHYTTVTAEEFRCDPGVVCNPPILNACQYNHSEYQGCIAEKDVTVVKKLADNTLVSERFVSQYGTPMNNYSFYIPEVTSVCVWEKQ